MTLSNLNSTNPTLHSGTESMFKGLLKGIPASEGIAIGKIWTLKSPWDEVSEIPLDANKVCQEIQRYQLVLQKVEQQLNECKARIYVDIGPEESKIFEAHLSILKDPFFQTELPESIRTRRRNAEFLLKEGFDHFRSSFSKVGSEFFRHRIDDIQDVAVRILRGLLETDDSHLFSPEGPVVWVAYNLTPSDAARIDRKKILGFATEFGGETSHVSILARSMGLPAVVGVERLMREAKNGDFIIVDGNAGIVYLNPPPRVIKGYRKLHSQFKIYIRRLSRERDRVSKTREGVYISLQANVSMTADVSMAVRQRTDGIGLFRTELPFLIARKLLTSEEQFHIYRTIVQTMKGKPVTIRTLDLGGDKFLPFQGVEKELNPFLGWRSIRISLQEKDVFKDQLFAILRASYYGKVRILYPMISSLEEIIEINKILEECKKELQGKNIPFDPHIPTGIMIEIPSAAIMADTLIRHVDFFSIGTNDLIQYTLAVDRNNEKVAKFYQPLNPAILRLIYNTIQAARFANKSVSLCGEMAGSPIFTPLLIGLGLRELSMSPTMLLEVKERIRALSISECESLAEEVLHMDSAEEINRRILEFHHEVNKRQTVPYLEATDRSFFLEESAVLSNNKKQ